MSNHLHCILKADGAIPLCDIVRDFKKITSRNIIDTIIAEPESRREWLLHKFRWNAADTQAQIVFTNYGPIIIMLKRYFRMDFLSKN